MADYIVGLKYHKVGNSSEYIFHDCEYDSYRELLSVRGGYVLLGEIPPKCNKEWRGTIGGYSKYYNIEFIEQLRY